MKNAHKILVGKPFSKHDLRELEGSGGNIIGNKSCYNRCEGLHGLCGGQ